LFTSLHKIVLVLSALVGFITAKAQITLETRDSIYTLMLNEEDTFTKLDLRYKFIAQTEPFYLDSILYYLEIWEQEYHDQRYTFGEARMRSMRSWYLNYKTEYEQALKLAHSALAIQDSLKDSTGIRRTLNRIGVLNLQFKRYEESATYLLQTLEMSELNKDTALIDICLNNLGIVYNRLQDSEKGAKYNRACYELRRFQKDTFWMAYSLYNLAELFFNTDKFDSSGHYYLQSVDLFGKLGNRNVVPAMVHTGLAKYYGAINQPELGLPHAEAAVKKARKRGIQDSEIEALQILANLEYEVGRYKKSYETLQTYQALREKIDSANNAVEITKIEEKYNNAQQAVEISTLKAKNLEAQNQRDQARFRAQIAYILAGLLVLIIIAVIVFLGIKKRTDQKVHEASFDKQVSDLKLVALRTQMNPHFIFNCINTAQNFIVKTEREKAYEYLAQFSKLIRNVLENSNKVYIPLQDEINQIKQYLELEAVRFEDKFSYDLDIDEALQQGVYEIPSMLIQPCVENAIIHGLVNKTNGPGHVSVRLTLNDNLVHIEVEDNGVGREKALQIKTSKQNHYKATATLNIQQRLDIIQQNTSEHIEYKITDLVNEGIPGGTHVFIALPYR